MGNDGKILQYYLLGFIDKVMCTEMEVTGGIWPNVDPVQNLLFTTLFICDASELYQ